MRFKLNTTNQISTLRYEDSRFILERGSYISTPSPNFERSQHSFSRRASEIYINDIDDNRKLLRDIEFRSPSEAASIAFGYQANGRISWVDENNVTIGEYLNRTNTLTDVNLGDFLTFYNDMIVEQKEIEFVEELNAGIKEFQTEYPIERIRNLTIEDYVLGTQSSRESLSYKLEFGKYSKIGPSIGGSYAIKFGIYYSEHGFKGQSGIIDNVDEFWLEFRNQLYNFLNKLANIEEPFMTYDEFPLLRGMSLILSKLAFLYYPSRFVSIATKNKLLEILKLFDFNFDRRLPAEQLSFLLNKELMESEEILRNGPVGYLGHTLWHYLELQKEMVENATLTPTYWLYVPGVDNGEMWDEFYSKGIMALGNDIGNLLEFKSKEEIKTAIVKLDPNSVVTSSYKNNVLAKWEFSREVKVGDIVIAKKGKSKLLGKGIVKSEYRYNPDFNDYASYREIEWVLKGQWDHVESTSTPLVLKALTNISKYPGYPEKLEKILGGVVPQSNVYGKIEFLSDVFMSSEMYDSIVNTLNRKKNIILQGSPGVGKTFCAKKIMHSINGKIDDTNIVAIQFHQSYSYEDFVQGYRPNDEGTFELKNGIFYDFVKKAKADHLLNKAEAGKYCIIIDEINRGNLSKVFGELMMLIESDKRDEKWSLKLTYSDEPFYIPENVFIIGTMNTADRSLTMVDYALRRRFAFINLSPAFKLRNFKSYLIEKNKLDDIFVERLISAYDKLNQYIDSNLGVGFSIGHSYFIDQLNDSDDTFNQYLEILEYEIKPLLREYFFDDETKLTEAIKLVTFDNED